MQNKGFIRVFTILLVLAAIYSLSFTFYTWKANKDADTFAQGDSNKRKQFIDSITSLESYYNFLGLRKFTYADCQKHELNLGLDLKGGMNVTLEISIRDMLLNLSNEGKKDSVLVSTLDRADQLESTNSADYVSLFGAAFKELHPTKNLRTLFIANEAMESKITFNSTNEEVLAVLTKEAQASVDNSFDIIRTRVDRFGVTQPNIQNIGNGRILVELPGVVDQDRVRDLLQSSAKLEFWETYDNTEVAGLIFKANTLLGDLNKVKDKTSVTDTSKKDTATIANKAITKDQLKQNKGGKKKDATKSQDEIRKENPLLALLSPNLDEKNQPIEGPVVGYATQSSIALIDSLIQTKEVQALIAENAPELKLAWSKKPIKGGFYSLYSLKDVGLDEEPALDGDVVVEARPDFSNVGGAAGVQMNMNADGAKEWKLLTRANVGRSIAIVLDGFVYSAPNVQGEIPNGISSISGNFTIQEATDLSNILKSGKLSAKAEITNAEFVGPTLGKQSIQKGLLSFVVAFILVLLYMFLYYKKAGNIANIALLLNLFLIFGILASLGAVLTLPGIAGIVLTMGMAVDANVIIYERIKEELALGKGIKLAISDGFKHALSAILDGQLTTLIIGIILYIFGKGPIQGFATTLVIGILTSLFCGIFITRLVFEQILKKKGNISFDNNYTKNLFKNVNVDVLGKRKIYFIASAIVVGIFLISMVTKQFSLSVDFVGGRSYVVEVGKSANIETITPSLKEQFGKIPEIKTYGESELKITTDYLINSKDENADNICEEKLYKGLLPILPKNITKEAFLKDILRQSNMVGPSVAHDIIIGAIFSIILALICIFLYIFVRFRNWEYGVGAVVSLAHDVIIIVGIFSLFNGILPFSMEIGQSFIAAILTVIGYSINDTVIVFDRIREIKTEFPKRNTLKIFNEGFNKTLARTINTTFTTVLVLLVIFLFGGETIQGFVFAMLIGIIVGTYSSFFIASSVTYELLKKGKKSVETNE